MIALARQESDREDLFAEAAGLRPRVEFVNPNGTTIVVGIRKDEGLLVFFSPQFSAGWSPRHELRRVFREGLIYRAQAGRVFEQLRRERTAPETNLLATTLSVASSVELADSVWSALRDVLDRLESGAMTPSRSFPVDVDAVQTVVSRIRMIAQNPPTIAPGMAG